MSARPNNAYGSPLVKKLGIKEGHRVAFPGAPDGFEELLGRLPEGVSFRSRAAGPLDVIVFFTTCRGELERRFPALRRALDPAGGLWIAWPKASSGIDTDLRFLDVQEVGLANKLVDNKVCAIDETWSGVRMVIRINDREPLGDHRLLAECGDLPRQLSSLPGERRLTGLLADQPCSRDRFRPRLGHRVGWPGSASSWLATTSAGTSRKPSSAIPSKGTERGTSRRALATASGWR